jgi:hypothetical protein
VNLLTAVTPIGQAYNDWNGAIVSIPLMTGTASAGSVTPTSISVLVGTASGGTAPYTYQWRRSTTSGSGYANVAGATSTSLVDTGLTSGTTYFYQCVATDALSATVTSNQVSATTPIPVPAVSPASTRVNPSGTCQFVTYNFTGGAVTWSAMNGSISGSGLYTALGTVGIDVVTATGVADHSQVVTVAISVRKGLSWFPRRRR